MCDYFGVSKSGFYSWKKRAKSKKIDRDNSLLREIKRVHRGQRKSYGSPRVYRALRKKGIVCSRRRVARLMQLNGIKASVVGLYSIRPNKHDIYQQADNVLGSVDKPTRVNQQWVADFTYLKTGEGWYYFAMILDRYSRKLVGWSFSKDRNTDFTKSSLIMALETEKPEGGLIFHTDQGIEYVSHKFQNKLREENLRPSMSRKGKCLDNAMAESFFHTMKTEMFHHKKYKTMTSVKKDILSFIDFYNNERLHSSLGYMSPEEFIKQAT